MPPPPQRRFVDASLLGLGQLLGLTDTRIIYPGHPDWPFGPSTADEVWLRYVGDRDWTAIMRDKKIKTRPAERQALLEHRVRAINITVSENQSPSGYAGLLDEYSSAIDRAETTAPAYYHLTRSGLKRHIEY